MPRGRAACQLATAMKRLIDLLIVVPGLILLSPLLAVVSVCIKLTSRGPVLFRQCRVGHRGQLFEICKFRTMVVGPVSGGPQVTAADDPRITRLGRFLRRTKLDELPQLLNVLKGEMSLVGPRPQVPRFVQHYPRSIRDIILSVRPGITDPATIRFRHEEEILAGSNNPERSYIEQILPHKLTLNVRYIRQRTLTGDLVILVRTVGCLVSPHVPQRGLPFPWHEPCKSTLP